MTPEGTNHSAATVMIVDDEPRVCRILERVLREQGYRVVTANSGRDAVGLASEVHPQLILLDIVMSGMDGIATLRELRQRGERGTVIILTAHGTIQTAREAMVLGAFDYITKPFNLEFLKSVLREGLADWERERGGSRCAR